jgi:uncharacterized protein (TIGR02145 family)
LQKYGFVFDQAGKSYKTVVIGTQTWMAENLNYKTPDGSSRCYPISGTTNTSDEDNANCDKYGRLYTWYAAMNHSYSSNNNPSGVQGVCPADWHIPSDAEWDMLMQNVANSNAVGGTKLKAISGWSSNNGTNDYGFSALPGGYYSFDAGFIIVGTSGYWWSSMENDNSEAFARGMSFQFNYVDRFKYSKSGMFSVRCVKDEP